MEEQNQAPLDCEASVQIDTADSSCKTPERHSYTAGERKVTLAIGLLTAGAALLLTALWTVLLLVFRDKIALDYFLSDSPMPLVFYGFLAAVMLSLLAFLFVLRSLPTPRLQDGLPTLFFTSGGVGLLLFAYGVLLFFVRVVHSSFPVGYVFTAIFAVAAALGFFLRIAPEGFFTPEKYRLFTVLTGLFGVLFALFYAMTGYFDNSMPINSPMKWMDQFFFLFVAFFLLYETGLRIDRKRFGLYMVLASATFILGTVNGIGGIALFLAEGVVLRGTILHDFLQLALALYAEVRLVAAISAVNAKESKLLSAISEEAVIQAQQTERRREERSRIRSELVHESELPPEEEGYVQQTIDFASPTQESTESAEGVQTEETEQ